MCCGASEAAEAHGVLDDTEAHGFLRESGEVAGYGNELGEKLTGEGVEIRLTLPGGWMATPESQWGCNLYRGLWPRRDLWRTAPPWGSALIRKSRPWEEWLL